jgi:hypothetical protein
VLRTPFSFEDLDLGVGKLVRFELAPGWQAALIAERQITDLANAAFRRALVETAGPFAKDLAGGGAIRLVSRILGGVVSPIGVQLPEPLSVIGDCIRI